MKNSKINFTVTIELESQEFRGLTLNQVASYIKSKVANSSYLQATHEHFVELPVHVKLGTGEGFAFNIAVAKADIEGLNEQEQLEYAQEIANSCLTF